MLHLLCSLLLLASPVLVSCRQSLASHSAYISPEYASPICFGAYNELSVFTITKLEMSDWAPLTPYEAHDISGKRQELIENSLNEMIKNYDNIHEDMERNREGDNTGRNVERMAAAAFQLNYMREFRKVVRKAHQLKKSLFFNIYDFYARNLAQGINRCYQIFYDPVKENHVDERCTNKGMMVAMINSDPQNSRLATYISDQRNEPGEVWLSTHVRNNKLTYNYKHAKVVYKNTNLNLNNANGGVYIQYNNATGELEWKKGTTTEQRRHYMCMYYQLESRQARLSELDERDRSHYL